MDYLKELEKLGPEWKGCYIRLDGGAYVAPYATKQMVAGGQGQSPCPTDGKSLSHNTNTAIQAAPAPQSM